MAKNKSVILDMLFLLVLVWIRMLFYNGGYAYGLEDHAVMVPLIKHFADPSLYFHDYMIAQGCYYPIGFFHVCAALVKYAHVPLPHLFFFLYFISASLIFLGVYFMAMALFKQREVAVLSLVLLVIAPIPTLGGVPFLDNLLLTRVVAYPVLLFTVYFFLNKKYSLSFFLLALALFIYPLSSIHLVLISTAAVVMKRKEIGLKRISLLIGILFVFVLFGLIQKFLYPMPGYNFLHSDPEWISLLRLRSSHHIFPFSWGMEGFLAEGIFFLCFLLSWKYKPDDEHHRIICSMAASVCFLFLCGTVFTELFPVTCVMQLQFFRSSIFLSYLFVPYLANYLVKQLKLKINIQNKFVIALMLISVLGGVLVSAAAKGYLVADQQNADWLEVQRWAISNTDVKDMFIVPPGSDGFRVESERAIYGDWKDGTMMFFNLNWGKEWFERMQSLGYQAGKPVDAGFQQLHEKDFMVMAQEEHVIGRNIFLVVLVQQKPLKFPVVHKNRQYVVYQVSSKNDL